MAFSEELAFKLRPEKDKNKYDSSRTVAGRVFQIEEITWISDKRSRNLPTLVKILNFILKTKNRECTAPWARSPWADLSTNPPTICICRYSFTGTQEQPLVYVLFMIYCVLQHQDWAVATETMGPESPKYLLSDHYRKSLYPC